MIHFVGDSFAALTLKEGARRRGLKLTDKAEEADLIFISQDTPTRKNGVRDLKIIKKLIVSNMSWDEPMVVTSQLPPGWLRSIVGDNDKVYHQAETLRIEDGLQRATYPEMFIVGHSYFKNITHCSYSEYLKAFDCPVFHMTYEEAEFAKIAINMTLVSQVENTNRLSEAASKCGADWSRIAQVLRHDQRIGKYSYLTPGDWKKSPHLLRDYVTLKSL